MILADWYYYQMMKILFKKEENMNHRFTIDDIPLDRPFIDHNLELMVYEGTVTLYCSTHSASVIKFFGDSMRICDVSCLRVESMSIPFEFHEQFFKEKKE